MLLIRKVPVVVVVPSLGRLLVGCVLLLTGKVSVVLTIPTVWVGEVMTDVIVVPPLGRLLVGCRLLLTGTVFIIVVAPSILVCCIMLLTRTLPVVVITPTVQGGVLSAKVDTVDTQHSKYGTKQRNVIRSQVHPTRN